MCMGSPLFHPAPEAAIVGIMSPCAAIAFQTVEGQIARPNGFNPFTECLPENAKGTGVPSCTKSPPGWMHDGTTGAEGLLALAKPAVTGPEGFGSWSAKMRAAAAPCGSFAGEEALR